MSLCANCNTQNAEGALECRKCGSPIGGENMEVLSLQLGGVCSTCDSYNEPGVRVCQNCGTPLSAEAAAEAQAAYEAGPSAEPPPEAPAAEAYADTEYQDTEYVEEGYTAPPAESVAEAVEASAEAEAEAAPVEEPAPAEEEDLDIDIAEVEERPDIAAVPTPSPMSRPAIPPPPVGGEAPPPVTTAQHPAARLLAEVAEVNRGGAPVAPPPGPPPGWVEKIESHEPAPIKLAPKRADDHPCPRCGTMNPPQARFCGSCGNKLAAAPAAATVAAGRAKLILIRGSGFEGATFRLNSDSAAAGRSEGLVLFPTDAYLADHHATFLYQDGNLVVRDEGGVNGIFVRLKGSIEIEPGTAFVVGERLLRYAGPLEGAPPQDGDAVRQGAPRPSGTQYAIEELLIGGRVGRRFVRPGPNISMGRANCDINWPQDGFVSAKHAEISVQGGVATLTDGGSANGTYLRLQTSGERPLFHGDYLLMGRQLLRVEIAA